MWFMKWQPIREAQTIQDGAIADLLMDNGKVIRAQWRGEAGTLGNCPDNKGERPKTSIFAWWPISGRRSKMIGLYEPVSFRVCSDL